jgi:hypothetical protein
MYPGPERPRTETALIEGVGEEIRNIDRMDLPVGSKFFVLAGPHVLTTKAKRDPMGRAPSLTFCFDAEAGRSYGVQARDRNDDLPDVFDWTEGVSVPTHPPAANGTCTARLEPAPQPGQPAAPPAGGSVPNGIVGGAPVDSPEATGPAVETTEPSAASEQAAAPAAVPAVDNEAPRFVSRRHPRGRSDEPQPSWFRHPGNGLVFDLGAFFGGEDLVTAQLADGSSMTLSAGQGVAFSIGGMWTPLWIGDRVGFGVGASAGWKYDFINASNASVSFSRYPVGASLHTLLRMDDRWLFLVKGGIQKELDIGISGSGDAGQLNGSLNGGLGGFGEAGFYYIFRAGGHVATAFTFRYTAIHDSAAGMSIPASNFGFLFYLFYNL